MLQRLHKGHQGIEGTRRRARQSVYWPGLDNEVKNIVESCPDCHKLLPSQQKEPFMSHHDHLNLCQEITSHMQGKNI